MKKSMMIFAFLLFGCSGEVIQENMNSMVGGHVNIAIAKLGIPEHEGEIRGGKYYLWDVSNSGSYSIPNTTYVGTTPIITYSNTSFHHHCKIRVFVNQQDIITTFDFEGNEGGCQHIAARLEK